MWHNRNEAADWAKRWLLEDALPLWWRAGVDRERGGFHDRIDANGQALDLRKRLRVQAQQTFVFCMAGRWGWLGPWRKAVEHGLDFIMTAHKRPDSLFRETPGKDAFDLADQAFVLLALAAAYRALGSPTELRREGLALVAALEDELAHPDAGFEEARPRQLPLRASPHMHMLEALLAWVAVGERHLFETKAGEIVALALVRLIDPANGSIGEYFDGSWLPAPGPDGLIREPGCQFEWAYLLHEASHRLEIDTDSSVDRLRHFGNRYGMRDGRAMEAVEAKGVPIDRTCRLWAQTERLRAMTVLGQDGAAAESFAVVQRYLLDAPLPGLWRERTGEDGRWIDEPAPASSLYKLVTGFEVLIDTPKLSHLAHRGAIFPGGKPDGIW